MARRNKVAKSVVYAIIKGDKQETPSFLSKLVAFFALYRLKLVRFRNDLFQKLRNDTWRIQEDVYEQSFGGEDALKSIDDMGFSGSVRRIPSVISL